MRSKRLAPLAGVTAVALSAIAIAACGSGSSSKHATTGASAPRGVIDAVLNEGVVEDGGSGREQFGTHSDRLPGTDAVPLAS